MRVLLTSVWEYYSRQCGSTTHVSMRVLLTSVWEYYSRQYASTTHVSMRVHVAVRVDHRDEEPVELVDETLDVRVRLVLSDHLKHSGVSTHSPGEIDLLLCEYSHTI